MKQITFTKALWALQASLKMAEDEENKWMGTRKKGGYDENYTHHTIGEFAAVLPRRSKLPLSFPQARLNGRFRFGC